MRILPLLVASCGWAANPARDALVAEADSLLASQPVSVMQKKLTPPSGDKHDYMSVSPYWWPDPATPGGLPYIRRDGEQNPARLSADYDRAAVGRMFAGVHTLALAFRETGREGYAEHAARFVRTWFLDPAARMNPNLDYAQAIAGRGTGRGAGIIDVRDFIELFRALGWLERSKAWSAADRKQMKAWCAQFLEWLQTSKNGREESRSENNHGTWYDVQLASHAIYTGQFELARRVLNEARTKRIAAQFEPDGRQPRELARTKSFSYSLMNLHAFFELAEMAQTQGIDLWHFETKDGRSIRKALDYLAPYANPARPWPGPQIDGGVSLAYRLDLAGLLQRAAAVYEARQYAELIATLPPRQVAESRWQLIWPRPR